MQKRQLYIEHSCGVLLLLAVVMSLFGSCAEYESIFSSDYVPEGEPASITMTVQLPNMMSVTRAAGISPDNEEMYHVSDLWVAAYSASTGKLTGTYYKKPNQVLKGHGDDGHFRIENMKVLSGANYVVAVANPSLNKGLDVNGGVEKSMFDLLNEADTWDKYKNLAVLLNGGSQSIQYSSEGILMTGIYYGDHEEYIYQEHVNEDDNPTAPMIIKPGENEMLGCIQLRRVASYVKFNIQVDKEYVDKDGDIINMKAVSWQVCNLPGVSYVHERHGSRNAADKEVSGLPESYKKATYHNSPVFEGAMTFPTSKDESNDNHKISWFDFYQMENKHMGIADKVKTYNDRELEFTKDGTNTGWYQSLVTQPDNNPAEPSYDAALSNNNASYVVIKAHLEYYYNAGDEEAYKPVRYDPAKEQRLRVADAIYTIHLGFCEGKEESSKAIDFNCRRNTQYTYNVFIAGVDQIRVEATSTDMEKATNGVEGTVTDVMGDVKKLDAHYGTFNIQLSDKDRMELAWRIQAPFGDSTIKMEYHEKTDDRPGTIKVKTGTDIYKALPKNQFYNWIQFRPTTSKDVLAPYPGDPRLRGRKIQNYEIDDIRDYAKNSRDVGVWYLEQLRDVVNYPHDVNDENDRDYQNYQNYLANIAEGKEAVPGDGANYSRFTTPRWYTVFVDEYVYEYDYKANNPSLTDDTVMDVREAWRNFVNKDPRYVWLALSKFDSSTDGESFYANSAYIISQESIQTYYTGTGNNGQALGIEATNESYNEDYVKPFGTNNADNDLPSYSGGYDTYNGRLNMYRYISDEGKINRDWNNIFKLNNDGDYQPRTNDVVESIKAKTYSIPDHEQLFMAACMGRNRDLNNNGVIDVNEIRWYLPTSENYIQLVLGAVSLRNPLFNFADYGMDDIQAGKGKDISHFAGSNGRQVWAEELAATSNIYQYGSPASNFRCIRNLGQEMYLEPDPSNVIGSAYMPSENEERTVELQYYDLSGLRDYTSGHITAHSVADIRSFPSRKFQYAKENCSLTNTQGKVDGGYFENNGEQLKLSMIQKTDASHGSRVDWSQWWEILKENTICGAYSEEDGKDIGTWRTPNISELAILRVLGAVLDDASTKTYISSSYEHFTDRSSGGYFEKDNPANPYKLYNHNFMGLLKGTNNHDISAGINGGGEAVYLRCVRDVE